MGIELPLVEPPRRDQAIAPIFHTVGIVGLGLIGGSIALAVRRTWPTSRLIGIDRPDVLDEARTLRTVDVSGDDLGLLNEADVVFLAAPVRQNVRLLEQLSVTLTAPVLVTDTGSTKRDIVEAARRLPAHVTFVAGHPLGGAAAAGLGQARPDLFEGRPWLFTPPLTAGGRSALEKLSAFAAALGSVPTVVDAEAHDRWLAHISHLPQLTASALMHVVGAAVGEEGLALAGRGLLDTTRLAASPAPIWHDVAISNADQIGPALDALIATLEELRRDLGKGDRLTEVFDRACEWRARLIKA